MPTCLHAAENEVLLADRVAFVDLYTYLSRPLSFGKARCIIQPSRLAATSLARAFSSGHDGVRAGSVDYAASWGKVCAEIERFPVHAAGWIANDVSLGISAEARGARAAF